MEYLLMIVKWSFAALMVPLALASGCESFESNDLFGEYGDFVIIGLVGDSERWENHENLVQKEFDRAGIKYLVGAGSLLKDLLIEPDRAAEAIVISKKFENHPDAYIYVGDGPGESLKKYVDRHRKSGK